MKRLFFLRRLFLGLSIVTCLMPTTSTAETTLNFYTWRPVDELLWNNFNDQNIIPGIKVKTNVILRNFYHDAVKFYIQTGQADLFLWTSGASNLKPLIDHNYIEPYPNALDQISKSALVAGQGPDGQYYGIPFAVQLESIIVNKKVARSLGVTRAPTTLAEFEETLESLKNQGVIPLHLAGSEGWYVSQVVAEVMVAGLIKEEFTRGLVEGTECFNSPEFKLIFEKLKHWVDRGYINPEAHKTTYGESVSAVAFGSSVMNMEGGWMTSKTDPYHARNENYEFDFWAVPGASSKFYAFGDGTFQVATTSNHSDAAKKLLDFTGTKKFAEMFAKDVNQLPAYGGEIDIPPSEVKTMSDILKTQAYSESLFNTYSINMKDPSYNSLMTKTLQGILKGDISPNEAAKMVQDGLNSWDYIGANHCQ